MARFALAAAVRGGRAAEFAGDARCRPPAPFRADGLLQMLDDCGPKMTFAQADIYSGKGLSLDKPNGRVLQPVVLSYRQVQSSRGFTLYERLGD